MVLFKFILIFFLGFYLLSKIGGFLVRLFFGNLAKHQRQQQNHHGSKSYRKPSDGNVNIEYAPEDRKSVSTEKDFKGGDYVEYEEVK
ncbi:MAG: DUF4834 family protein [Reichenbachiella sp.]